MARYLLDTNILSDVIRNPSGAVARRIAVVGESAIATSIVVACELRFGARKKGSLALTERVESLLGSLEVLPLEPDADRHYAEIRAQLEADGVKIGPNDLLIASHARALDLTVVTANEEEFSRVPRLFYENWLSS